MTNDDDKKPEPGGVLEAVGLKPSNIFDEQVAAQCDRCRIKELEPIGLGAHHIVGGQPCWLCDRCYTEVIGGA